MSMLTKDAPVPLHLRIPPSLPKHAQDPFHDRNAVTNGEPVVSRMKHEDEEMVLRTLTEAFKDDAGTRYIIADGNTRLLFIANGIGMRSAIHQRISKRLPDYIINGGISWAWLDIPPKQQSPPTLSDRIIGLVAPLLRMLYTKEQKKRSEEMAAKYRKAVKDFLGVETAGEAFYLSGLATLPAFQGHGYASLLVETILRLVDAEDRYVWLSALQHNVGFYEIFGFKSIGFFTLGEDNPTWKEDPIVMHLMLRAPRDEKWRAYEKDS